MRLRPHHLLCTQSYSGKGYDESFVRNMNQITQKLRGSEPVPVEIVFSTDDLCAHCPNMLGENLCRDNDKVLHYDKMTARYFNIEEKTYIYQEITQKIREKMTPGLLEEICRGCEWYPVSACKRVLCQRVLSTESCTPLHGVQDDKI